MTVGIIGAGLIGTAVARRLAAANIPGVLSNSRGPGTLSEIVSEIGGSVRAGTKEEAASLHIVLVAVPWSKLPSALKGLPDFSGRVVIDANNPIEAPAFKAEDLNGMPSTEVFTRLVPGARVVKAFNHLSASLLAQDPREGGGKRVLFFAGGDEWAKSEVARLIEKLGFKGIDLGQVTEGGRQFAIPGGPLATQNLISLDGPK